MNCLTIKGMQKIICTKLAAFTLFVQCDISAKEIYLNLPSTNLARPLVSLLGFGLQFPLAKIESVLSKELTFKCPKIIGSHAIENSYSL